jgi:hypothetical protein
MRRISPLRLRERWLVLSLRGSAVFLRAGRAPFIFFAVLLYFSFLLYCAYTARTGGVTLAYKKERLAVLAMPIIHIVPTKDHPVPDDTEDQKPNTFVEELEVAANTVELQEALGAFSGGSGGNTDNGFNTIIELSPEDEEREKRLLEEVVKNRKSKNLALPNTAYAAAAFLKTYGQQLAFDAAATRAAITNKLMEIANCGDPKYELRALELLGKHSDIGLFTERSEITINYQTPEALETAIKERVKRLLNADIIDVTPVSMSLDEELGVYSPDDGVEEIAEIEAELGAELDAD